MPVSKECAHCGHSNHDLATECENCGASLSDSFVQAYCDRCGVMLPEGVTPVGACLKCQKPVYMCQNHRAKVVGEELFCKDHESDCFIATAVFGTALDSRIDILRELRDRWLMATPLGKAFVFAYYEVSPSIARRARYNWLLRRFLRKTIVNPALHVTRMIFNWRAE